MFENYTTQPANKYLFDFGGATDHIRRQSDVSLPLINRTLLSPEVFYPQMCWGYLQQYEIMNFQEMYFSNDFSSFTPLNQFILNTKDSESSENNR